MAQPATLLGLLDTWGIDGREDSDTPVRVLRHSGDEGYAEHFYRRGLEILETYQSYQKNRKYGDAKLLVSFIGKPGGETAFVGVYKVRGVFERGKPGFIEVKGDLELSARCERDNYYYDLVRDTRFDQYQGKIRIAWGRGTHIWCQGLPQSDKEITSIVTMGEQTAPQNLFDMLTVLEPLREDSLFESEAASYSEGHQYYRSHLCRELNLSLVRNAKAQFKAQHGRLFCEACHFDFLKEYGETGDGYIECHHTIPICTLTSGARTKLEDIAMLCSNCHRMIHRKKEWLSMSELKNLSKLPQRIY